VREFSGCAVAVGVDVGRSAMMRPVGEGLQVYLHRAPVDMRRGRNGLAALAKEVMLQDPFSQALFVFVGRKFDTLKILGWDRNGYALWYKKIESEEKFHWPRLLQEDVITLTVEQLNWLLDGYDVWASPHRMIKFTHVS
jgi:transposase